MAVPHLQRLDADDGAEFLVTHMEVGRVMVVEVHRDDDSQEAAYLGHGLSPCVWAFGFILPPCRKDKRRVVETDFPESGGGPSPRPSPRSRGEGEELAVADPLPVLAGGVEAHLGPALHGDLQVVLVAGEEHRVAVDVGGE